MTRFYFSRNSILATAFFVLLILGCAEVGAPPGGEEDKTRPMIVSSEPANGSTLAPIGNQIRINFSERINAPRVGDGLFISPRPPVSPQIKWKSDYVEIQMADSFALDQTYVISVSSEVRDLRSNPIDTGSIIAFSTGPSIDSGTISGLVASSSNRPGGVKVALFDPAQLTDSLRFDSVYPAYLTQTGTGGLFSFGYLPQREFFLIAFEDKDQDGFFDPYRESFALPDRPTIVGGTNPLDSLYLSMTRYDSASQEIAFGSVGADRMVKLRMAQPIEYAPYVAHPERIRLRPTGASGETTASCVLESYAESGREIDAFFAGIAPGYYDAIIQVDSLDYKFDSLFLDSARDSKAPQIMNFSPGTIPVLPEDLNLGLTFSEPIGRDSLSAGTFSLMHDTLPLPPPQAEWINPLTVRFTSNDLTPGRAYRLTIAEFEISDMSVNLLGDSISEYTFKLLAHDSLGTATGSIVNDSPDSSTRYVIRFTNYQNSAVHNFGLSGREFSVTLPAGKYQLSGFVDRDGDGEQGRGSLYPFSYSESFSTYPDTVKVRARFETAEIQIQLK